MAFHFGATYHSDSSTINFSASTGLFLAAFQKTEAIVENMIAIKINIGRTKCHHSKMIRSEYFSRYYCVR